MIHISICDDEREEIKYIAAITRDWAATRSIAIDITEYECAESFLFAYEDDKTTSILLLDIQMKNMDGIELAYHIRKDNDYMQIIFITGYPDFIELGYDVSALHYLMKPVKKDKLLAVLDRAFYLLNKKDKPLIVDTVDGTALLPVGDILFLEAFAHKTDVRLSSGEVVSLPMSIKRLDLMLDKSFIRCHRSYIAGLRHISYITKTDIVLSGGVRVPLSRRLYTKVNREFIEFYRKDG